MLERAAACSTRAPPTTTCSGRAAPSAATQAAHARARSLGRRPGGEVQPLPKFGYEELGDRIDCTICVQVCPTGIDIRNGLQYECIACGACIDACNEVMDKMGYPKGLIRYSTQNAIDGKPTRVLRPRILVYGLLLAGFMVAWAVGVGTRSDLIVEALRDRNALYRETADGLVENAYTLKLVNKADDRAGSGSPSRARRGWNCATMTTGDRRRRRGGVGPGGGGGGDGASGRNDIRFVVESEDGAAARWSRAASSDPCDGRSRTQALVEDAGHVAGDRPAAGPVVAGVGLAGRHPQRRRRRGARRRAPGPQIQTADLARRRPALGLSAVLRADEGAAGDRRHRRLRRNAASVRLVLQHPSRQAEDVDVELAPDATGWSAGREVDHDHDWVVQLAASDGAWRLQGRLPRGQRAVRLAPSLAP